MVSKPPSFHDPDPPLPQLTIQQLHYLVTVAQAPTWAQAATELGVTPSALSQGLAELERRVGIRLFSRDGRRRVLTPAAEVVVEYAASVVASTRQLSRWVQAARTGRQGQLHLGMIDAAAVFHFPTELRTFRDARPDVELKLTVAPSGELLRRLRAAELDVAVVVEPSDDTEDLVMLPLLHEDLALYAPPGTTRRPSRDWGPFVLFPSGSHTRRSVVHALSELGATVDIVAESHQPEVLKAMVNLGLGWTVLPTHQAESGNEPLSRMRQRPIAQRQLVAVRRRDAITDYAADALITHLVTPI